MQLPEVGAANPLHRLDRRLDSSGSLKPQQPGVLVGRHRGAHLIVELVQLLVKACDFGITVALGLGQRRGALLQTHRDLRQLIPMPVECGACSTHLTGLIDRMLRTIADVPGFEFFLRFAEVVVGFLDVVARPVKRIRELVDRPGITTLKLVVQRPRITTGKGAQVTGIQVDQPDRRHRRAYRNSPPAAPRSSAADSSASLNARAAKPACPDRPRKAE